MTKCKQRSLKKKQKLYEKFLKNRTYNSEKTYSNYEDLFGKIKNYSKNCTMKINFRNMK